jgi:hypothetical protein
MRSGKRDTGGFQSSAPIGYDRGGFAPETGAPREIPAAFDQGGFDQMHPMHSPHDYQLPRAEVTVLWELGRRQFAWRGRLDRYDGIGVNEQTRTVPCRVVVEEPRRVMVVNNGDPRDLTPATGGPPALVRGMYVRVRIHCQPNTPLVRLPERAIRPGNTIWLLRDGKLVFEKVQVATLDHEMAILDAAGGSIAPGDKVVVSALAHAHAGMEVKEETPAPAQAEGASEGASSTADRSRSKL